MNRADDPIRCFCAREPVRVVAIDPHELMQAWREGGEEGLRQLAKRIEERPPLPWPGPTPKPAPKPKPRPWWRRLAGGTWAQQPP
jgi:hypothetical protein